MLFHGVQGRHLPPGSVLGQSEGVFVDEGARVPIDLDEFPDLPQVQQNLIRFYLVVSPVQHLVVFQPICSQFLYFLLSLPRHLVVLFFLPHQPCFLPSHVGVGSQPVLHLSAREGQNAIAKVPIHEFKDSFRQLVGLHRGGGVVDGMEFGEVLTGIDSNMIVGLDGVDDCLEVVNVGGIDLPALFDYEAVEEAVP